MKKIFALFLAVMMIAAMAIPAFAEDPIGEDGGSANVNVNGIVQYTGSSETQTVSVDLSWEEMNFTYVEGVHYGWDPETHEYAGGYDGYWETSEADITVTNHSNTEVKATLSFEGMVETVIGTFTEASGTLDDSVLELDSAVDTEVEEAPSATATFGVSGSITETAEMLGEITVLIEVVNYVPVPKITAVGFVETDYLTATFDRLNRFQYTATIPGRLPIPFTPPVILVGENLGYATGETCQIALLNSDGTLFSSYVFNTTNFNYDLEKGFWTTTTWEIPKTAGTYQLAYSNDGGETWTKIGQPLTIVISAI